jgi:sulfatase maturation enzyme AslB (radical SAM superfamily)
MYYEIVDFLPQIPDHLLDDLETIETYKNTFKGDNFTQKYGKPYQTDFTQKYASYEAPEKLYEFIQSYFSYPVVVRYQIIKKSLGSHIDLGKSTIKYNYILDTGGNCKTRWWNDVAEKAVNLLYEVESKPFVWHTLNVSVPHSVTEPIRPRISVTVTKK